MNETLVWAKKRGTVSKQTNKQAQTRDFLCQGHCTFCFYSWETRSPESFKETACPGLISLTVTKYPDKKQFMGEKGLFHLSILGYCPQCGRGSQRQEFEAAKH